MSHWAGRPACLWVALAVIASAPVGREVRPASDPGRRMSFHNRLLLNRAAVSGLSTVEVLLLTAGVHDNSAADGSSAVVGTAVTRLGGRVLRTDPAVGYLRVEIPIDRLLELVDSPAIDAYQISSLSRGAWYRDGPPVSNAQMFRGFEVTPIAAAEPSGNYADLPPLTPGQARAPGFTADDAGVSGWLATHPTFDGRGVTIALLESALPSFNDPALRSAKTLDAHDVSKIAGILNAVDASNRDETRVRLDTAVGTSNSWARVGNRTYVLPRAGRYRVGLLEVPAGANLVHQFAVLEDQGTGEVWIDSNGDASFQDETPLVDVNERFDPRPLKLTAPRKLEASFVMARGREPHVVHIYIGKGSHQTMTVSVAAGGHTPEGLASGVAPNARVLLVRMYSTDTGLGNTFEAFIDAARRPDVDVISVSAGFTIVPDTAADFAGSFFSRVIGAYDKPIVNAAGNTSLMLGSAHAYGAMLSTGGIISPATYAALYGGRPLEQVIVHPMSAGGPALDGAIKPDFLAPMERLAVDLPWNSGVAALPRRGAAHRVPVGYQISCCTSATSPYAAGVAALLISGAKQSRVPYSAARLSRAMRMSARPVTGYQPHQQGNGVLDIDAAWRALRTGIDPPRIVASATIVHPLAQYAARGAEGQGILEFEGWSAGTVGRREIRFRRESGAGAPMTYRLSWVGNDGTFSTAPTITLPLGVTVPLTVNITVRSAGPHSALLDLRDAITDEIAFRTQATIVAAERLDSTNSARMKGTVGLMRQRAHYVRIPAGAAAIAVELEVLRGVIQPTILRAHGLSGDYYMHVHPMNTFFVGRGRYHVMLPNPEPGTWTFRFDNRSAWFNLAPSFGPHDVADAEYALTVRVLGASLSPAPPTIIGAATVDIVNTGGAIAEPVLEARAGWLKSHTAAFPQHGLPHLIEINVPTDAASLSLRVRSAQPKTTLELYLYDCSSGECFSYDIAFPAATSHLLVVRTPAAGRWIAAVNAAPFPSAAGTFVLDEIITTGTPVRRASGRLRPSGTRWREILRGLPAVPAADGGTPVVLVELLDSAAERAEREHPWSTAPHYVALRDRPIAIAAAVYRGEKANSRR